jgi:hypothetical protein
MAAPGKLQDDSCEFLAGGLASAHLNGVGNRRPRIIEGYAYRVQSRRIENERRRGRAHDMAPFIHVVKGVATLNAVSIAPLKPPQLFLEL